MECQVESLMRNEVLLRDKVGFTFPKRPYQEELEGRLLSLIDQQEDQVRQLEEDRYPHQHLNSNLKMPILHSFKENKLEYEDEDEVKIMMMGTGMDKESLEHNLYEDDITLIICHYFSLTLNPPIKPKDSGNFRMKVV
ncbi:hypothetical protein Tco_1497235 [Tanacetum coccineum]